jgi:hypothetical protein
MVGSIENGTWIVLFECDQESKSLVRGIGFQN